MSSSDDKRSGGFGFGSLFGFLFDAETRALVDKEYQEQRRAMEGLARDPEQGIVKKPESEARKEGEPKCWIN